MTDWLEQRRELRRLARQRRAALSAGARRRAAEAITRTIARSIWLVAARRVALYASRGDEPDTRALRRLAERRGCAVSLPRILNYREHTMQLCADTGTTLQLNRFGIPEPPASMGVAAACLDSIFVPTLAFTAAGVRLGSGGGYYDRWLARLSDSDMSPSRRPLLIGIAYACTELPALRAAVHDVPLDIIVTEADIHLCRQGNEA